MQPPIDLHRPLRRIAGPALALALCIVPAPAQHPLGQILPILLPEDELSLRASALRRLAATGTLEALSEVLDALDDPAPLLADTAQLACRAIDTPDAAALLLGRLGLQHADAGVRLRAAEAIGRTRASFRADLFRSLLPRADSAECRALLASIEQLAQRRQLTGDLDETAQWIQTWIRGKHDDEMRAIALATVSAMSAARGARYTASVLDQKAPPQLKASALARCFEFLLPGARTELQACIDSPSAIVRAAAVRVLDSQGDREALTWLVDGMEREPRLGLRWRAVEALQYLTALPIELDPAGWRSAVNALPLDWNASQNRNAVPRGSVTDVSLTELATCEPRSDRWVLVTHLASVLEEDADQPRPSTRRERILAERRRSHPAREVTDGELHAALAEILARVASDALSDVIVAGPRVARLGRAPAAHSPARVEQAQHLVDDRSSSEAGDLHGALLAALDTDGVDRVMLVTRGGARTGRHVELELIVDLVVRHARFRPVAIDVVLVDTQLAAEVLLRRLAAETRGRVLKVVASKPSPR